jgi:hypothetical protein
MCVAKKRTRELRACKTMLDMMTDLYKVAAMPKPPMHRQIIAFTEVQQNWLRTEAARAGISLTEFLRRLVDKARGTL